MDFLTEHNLLGLVIGIATFLIIGLFHPVVIKAEYYWGTRCWWIFLLLGLGGVAGSLATDNVLVGALAGVFAFSSFWTIKELFEQQERVRKGWFPANPKRQKQNSGNASKNQASSPKKRRKPRAKQVSVRNGRALQMYGDPVRPEKSEQERRPTKKGNGERASKKAPQEQEEAHQGSPRNNTQPVKKSSQETPQVKTSRKTSHPEKPQETASKQHEASSTGPQQAPRNKPKKKPQQPTETNSSKASLENSIDNTAPLETPQETSQETSAQQAAPRRRPNRRRRPQRAKSSTSNDPNAAKNDSRPEKNPSPEINIAQAD